MVLLVGRQLRKNLFLKLVCPFVFRRWVPWRWRLLLVPFVGVRRWGSRRLFRRRARAFLLLFAYFGRIRILFPLLRTLWSLSWVLLRRLGRVRSRKPMIGRPVLLRVRLILIRGLFLLLVLLVLRLRRLLVVLLRLVLPIWILLLCRELFFVLLVMVPLFRLPRRLPFFRRLRECLRCRGRPLVLLLWRIRPLISCFTLLGGEELLEGRVFRRSPIRFLFRVGTRVLLLPRPRVLPPV